MNHISCVLLLCSLMVVAAPLWAQDKDTADNTDKIAETEKKSRAKEPKLPYVHQFSIGYDLSSIIFNIVQPGSSSYEIAADYALRKNIFLAAETGFGNGSIDYDHLQYQTNSYFIRVGVNKSLLDKLTKHDFDIAFIGARYGIGIGQRSKADYFIPSPFGPDIPGHTDAQDFIVHWGELTAGIRVEFWKGVYAGWNVRAKFLLNPGVFEQLAPNYIAGYGKGDKSTTFGFNFYLCYALRWGGSE